MEALRKVALAYYNSGTDEERRLFNQFFQSMDKDGNRRVSYREFADFMSLQAHDENMRTRDFFDKLNINRSGGLDSMEVLTLYYILKSGRPICGQCKTFVSNEYFTCMKCFERQTAAYSICLKCFRDKGGLDHNHARSYFVSSRITPSQRADTSRPDHSGSPSNTPAVGRVSSRITPSQRTATSRPDHSGSPSNTPAVGRVSSRITPSQRTDTSRPDHSGSPSNTPAVGRVSSRITPSQRTATSRPDHSGSPSNLAIVPYNPNIPGERRNPWQVYFRLLEAGLHLASIVAGCSVM
ncbi:hypothetical protein WN944_025645 [Citrus x changshan-huyou]|uniref:EF-hand domain-containing protein n=1 Tax=Citrus x changshan-huyou TaxID=2935761 RepID=A0AAP0LUU5_9ROSI